MSSIVIKGDTSGQVTLDVPAIAGTTILNLPASSGTVVVGSVAASAVGQIPFSTDGATYTPTAKIVSGTAVASTSGTSVDFTGIPSWAKRITVLFNAVSTNGTSLINVRLGTSGGVVATGYACIGSGIGSGVGTTDSSTGFIFDNGIAAGSSISATCIINNLSGNIWLFTAGSRRDGANQGIGNGQVTLSGTLNRIRITTAGGTDAFDAGSINILYE